MLVAKPLMYTGRGMSEGKHSMRLEHFGMLFCLPTPACPVPKCPEIIFSLPSSYSIFQPLTDFLGTQKRCLDNSQVIIHTSQRNKGESRGFSTVSDYNWHTSLITLNCSGLSV